MDNDAPSSLDDLLVPEDTPTHELEGDELRPSDVADLIEQIQAMTEELAEAARKGRESLRAPFEREDLVALIYGRHADLTKRAIRATLDTINEMGETAEASPDAFARKCIINMVGRDATKTQTRMVLKAIRDLGDRYSTLQ